MSRLTPDRSILEYDLNRTWPGVFCFSTTRHGGQSNGPYASFNCNPFCGDSPAAVAANRSLLETLLPAPLRCLVIPHQTHGDTVRCIDEAFLRQDDAAQAAALEGVDALVTDLPHVCLGISTADCIPVLCYDTHLQVAAAIHAGWRGTVRHIVAQTIRLLKDIYGSHAQDLTACIGPGISQAAFEVGDEVYEAFREAGFPMADIACRHDKWHIDLWEANRRQLVAEGIAPQRIETAGICTYTRHDDFFSARRLGIRSGRILTGIVIQS